MVAQQPDEVLVAREDPHLGARVPVDGIGLPQPAEVGVGIGDDLGGEEILGVGRSGHLRARHGRMLRPAKRPVAERAS